MLKKMVNEKQIKTSQSQRASPIVMVKKPDRKDENGDQLYRLTTNFKELNKCIKDEIHPIPKIRQVLDKLLGKKVFTVIDLKDGFHQLKLDEESQELCALITPIGVYQYLRMPMGIKVAPSIFQREIAKILEDTPGELYIDDIILGADSIESLYEQTNEVLETLAKRKIVITPSKCHFGMTKVKYLGYQITPNGVRIDPQTIDNIEDKIFKTITAVLKDENKSVKDLVKSTVGIVQYYSQFCPMMADKLVQLTDKLRKNGDGMFRNEDLAKIKEIIYEFRASGAIAPADPSLPTIVATDASNRAIGFIATQDQDGEPKIIDMASAKINNGLAKRLTSYQIDETKLDSAFSRELFAIDFAMTRLQDRVRLSKVTVLTDHKAITDILKRNWGQWMVGKNGTIMEKIRISNVTVEWIPRKDNIIANALAKWRKPDDQYTQRDRLADLKPQVTRYHLPKDRQYVKDCQAYLETKKQAEDGLKLKLGDKVRHTTAATRAYNVEAKKTRPPKLTYTNYRGPNRFAMLHLLTTCLAMITFMPTSNAYQIIYPHQLHAESLDLATPVKLCTLSKNDSNTTEILTFGQVHIPVKEPRVVVIPKITKMTIQDVDIECSDPNYYWSGIMSPTSPTPTTMINATKTSRLLISIKRSRTDLITIAELQFRKHNKMYTTKITLDKGTTVTKRIKISEDIPDSTIPTVNNIHHQNDSGTQIQTPYEMKLQHDYLEGNLMMTTQLKAKKQTKPTIHADISRNKINPNDLLYECDSKPFKVNLRTSRKIKAQTFTLPSSTYIVKFYIVLPKKINRQKNHLSKNQVQF
uniref:Reverse transcriptase domain-containing protein n=1 Tax=Clytia hemisphaerica TaxID=252671 RepID=A0A7M5XDE8_9CNID